MKSRNLRPLLVLLLMCILIIPIHCTSISAATKFTLSNDKQAPTTLYANHSYTLKLRGKSVNFYSSNNYIASINKRTGKLTVKEPGIVTISAKSRYSSITLYRKTFTVKRRTDYLYTNKKTITLVTGETAKVLVKKSPVTSTDVFRYQSSNKNVATVNSSTGQVKAVSAGTAYITVYSKANALTPNNDSSNKKIRIRIKVYSSIVSAKQVGLDQVEVTFSGKPASLTYHDFKLVNNSNNTVNVVAVSITDNTVLLTLGKKLTDGKQYSVKYKSSSCNFTATDGKITKFVFAQTKVPIKVATAVVAYSYDKYGIQIGEYIYGNTYPNISFNVYSSNITSDKRLNFPTTKGTASARITYYETVNGLSKTIVDSGSISITSFDPELVSAQYRCHITRDYNFKFSKTTECNLALSLNSGAYYAFFDITKSNGQEMGDYSQYIVEPADKNILITGSTTIDSSLKYISLYPIRTGTTYLNIKDTNGSPLFSFPVTVRPASKFTNLTVSNHDIYMPNDQTDLNAEVTLTATDQYGTSMNDYLPYGYAIECIATTAKYVTASEVNANNYAYYRMEYPKLTFLSYQLQPGNYTYKITMEGKSVYVNVTIAGNQVRTY